jgi:hypothetical protein
MKRSMSKLFAIASILAMVASFLPFRPASAATAVFFNEIHYDNSGTDSGEGIEIAGPAGTDLTGWSIVLYNGSGGAPYNTTPLIGTIPDLGGSGYGVVSVSYPTNGIQNGSPDGMALVDGSSNVIQFLSYEGTFSAVGGPANGLLSTDIGVSENGTGPVGDSLQLTGTGTTYEDFTWAAEGPNTFGAFNTGQSFSVVLLPTNPSGVGLAAPATLTAGGTTLLSMAVTPGANPTSSGLAVSCDQIPPSGPIPAIRLN